MGVGQISYSDRGIVVISPKERRVSIDGDKTETLGLLVVLQIGINGRQLGRGGDGVFVYLALQIDLVLIKTTQDPFSVNTAAGLRI